jgi:ferric-dicitrate binding protein FerR (iron transport regulator)
VHPTQEQLIAYFSGNASTAEVQLVEDWLSSGADSGQAEESIRLVMETMAEPYSDAAEPPARTLLAHERFRERIGNAGGRARSAQSPVLRRILRPAAKYVAGVAAVLLLALTGTGLYRHYQRVTSRDGLAVASRNGLAITSRDTTFYATKTAITRIRLTDSSVVSLFPGSILTVSGDFNTSDRKVSIMGRGYFEVVHDASKPFYVKTGHMTTTVAGTAFEVNTTDTTVAVVIVKEGRVNVSEDRRLLSSLIHDQAIKVNKVSGVYTLQQINAAACCNWTRGKIDFRQVSLREILHTLAPWYDVSFSIRRPWLWDKKFTFYIRGQGLKESMDFLAAAGCFRYTIDHQKVFIQ